MCPIYMLIFASYYSGAPLDENNSFCENFRLAGFSSCGAAMTAALRKTKQKRRKIFVLRGSPINFFVQQGSLPLNECLRLASFSSSEAFVQRGTTVHQYTTQLKLAQFSFTLLQCDEHSFTQLPSILVSNSFFKKFYFIGLMFKKRMHF